MEDAKVTPRDKYSSIIECIENVCALIKVPFFLKGLDLAYLKHIKCQLKPLLADKENTELVEIGMLIPIQAMINVSKDITTPYVTFLDNDTYIYEGWLAPILKFSEVENSALGPPLNTRKKGTEKGAELRNLLYTN
ncbi:MAG: hypothetical protein RPR97_01925 [Colwellia sp.]